MAERQAKQSDARARADWQLAQLAQGAEGAEEASAAHVEAAAAACERTPTPTPTIEVLSCPADAAPGSPEGPRPRRGLPEQTRARLIRVAAQVFNRMPYWEADTNAVAKEAGYSTGTFYRHFKDKREIFIAAYREWIAEEWANIEATITPGQSPAQSIDRAADALIEHHRRWRVFRGNLRALVTYDEELRELTQALRREQLEKMSMLRTLMGQQPARTLESDAVHAMMFERVCDGIADGEFKSLGCSVEVAQREFQTLMRQYLLDPGMQDRPEGG